MAEKFIAEVDQYILKAKPFAQPILEHLRGLVHHYCPLAEEKIKWGFPNFDYKGAPLCSMAAFKNHCAFGFWKAALLKSDKINLGANNSEGMGHLGKIKDLKELPSSKEIGKLIKQAMVLNDRGITLKREPKSKNKVMPQPPAEFLKLLNKHKPAVLTFDGLSDACRREYLNWILSAKRPETKEKRIKQSVIWLSEGKRLNWKYEK